MWKALVVVNHMSWLAGRWLDAVDRCERIKDSGRLSVSDRQVRPERYQITLWFRIRWLWWWCPNRASGRRLFGESR
jgi:hypothetical protein